MIGAPNGSTRDSDPSPSQSESVRVSPSHDEGTQRPDSCVTQGTELEQLRRLSDSVANSDCSRRRRRTHDGGLYSKGGGEGKGASGP